MESVLNRLVQPFVALRLGRKIEWDSAAMKVTNIPEANELLHRKYRQGWEL